MLRTYKSLQNYTGEDCIRFADFELWVSRLELRRRGSPCPIEPRIFELLVYLIAHRHRVVTKAELAQNVWMKRTTPVNAISRSIMKVRQILGDEPHDPRFVKTIHSLGYRFIAELGGAPGSSEPD